jgi:GT2 family glycosyltransferase
MSLPSAQPDPTPLPLDVIICHHAGRDFIETCLTTLFASGRPPARVVVVDNASTDGSRELIHSRFPQVTLIESQVNLGFARATNLALQFTEAEANPYVFLLNNDTQIEPGSLERLMAVLETHPDVAACQPKMRSLERRDQFDYAGGAGGYLDRFGYPFTRGRVSVTLEPDLGQYDRPTPIFWASGAACLIRRSALREVGPLDGDFYAVAEEIDLAWRLHLRGYRVVCEPSALLYHYAGFAPGRMSLDSSYLRHRNSLVMLIKNYSARSLARYLPVRLALELMAIGWALGSGNFGYALVVVRSLVWVAMHLPAILRKRRHVQTQIRSVPDEAYMGLMYPRSIALDYFVFGKRTFGNLGWQGRE